MTPEQRYFLDICGYIVIPDAVEPDALRAAVRLSQSCFCVPAWSHSNHPVGLRVMKLHTAPPLLHLCLLPVRQQAAAFGATAAARQARSAGTQDHRWDLYSDPALSALAFTPKVWPVVLELTRNQPMVRLGIGIHDAPHAGGGGVLHCNREYQRSSTAGSSSMASYWTDGQTITMTDFGMFVYLNDVNPGDGGLLMVHGSHKAQFERPPSVGGTYGSGNWPVTSLGVRDEDHIPEPHPCAEGDRAWVPDHCVNVCPKAGDIVIMSECVVHSNMSWHGDGHRHVLRIGFKPAWAAWPEEAFSDEEIMRLPPEIRELRSHAPLGRIKSIAQPGRGTITLSPPNGAPVTDDERTHGRPYHVTGPGDSVILQRTPTKIVPTLPPIPGGMTDEQRYYFDIHGYCKLEGVLQGKELTECQAAALDYIEHSERGDVPEGFKQTPGGKYLHAHAWASCLENLAMHPRVWPTILELLDGKPQLTAESGTLFWEDYSRRAHLSDNYDPLRNVRVSVAGSDGVHLHCGREGLFAHGMEFDELHCGYFRELHGRLHCGNFAMFVYLSDVAEGDGGLLVVEGSHKAAFQRPAACSVFHPFGGDNPVPAAEVNGPPWDPRRGIGLKNVVPLTAGDVLLMPEALTHGVMPWAMNEGTSRLMLIFRFDPQHNGTLPEQLPPAVEARLSDETRELMQFAHVTHTKSCALEYRQTFIEQQPRL